MRRIDTPDGLYHDADPNAGVAGTVVKAGPLNSLQEEIISVITAAGLELDDASTRQLLDAILAITGGGALPWGAITDKPATFPPSAHTHEMGDVIGLVNALAGKATPADITAAVNALTGRLFGVRKYNVAGTYTYNPTAGTRMVIVEVVGGGGGSAASIATGSSTVSTASGGGGGAYGVSLFTNGFSGVTVTVGAGGAGAPQGNAVDGSNGGTSSFGALLSASGGYGGPKSQSINSGTTGTSYRAPGGDTVAGANIHSALGGYSLYGFALGNKLVGGDGGASGKGAPGPAGRGSSGPGSGDVGGDGIAPGTGASGGCGNTVVVSQHGGNGAPGEVIIWEYC